MGSEINKTKSMVVILKDETHQYPIGSAFVKIEGDSILNSLRIKLEDLKLLFKKGETIYVRE